MIIIKVHNVVDKGPVDFPVGTMHAVRDDLQPGAWEIPDGWIEMPQGEPIPDEYPEVQRLFADTFGSARFPDFRARVLPDKK